MRRRWVLACLVLAGCSRCGSTPAGTSEPAASTKPIASAMAPKDASGNALDDLLHFTDARLGVSSKVKNPRDLAEHIADGKLETAWNGKTGDLVGGWIGFRIPREARVRLVELTVGYVATSKKGDDLFEMNHRIAKVRVTRDGVALGEHKLDPDSRAFQKVALDAAGGDFKLEVLEVKPGSKKEWRELVVSEIRVFGIAGPAKRAAAAIPRVIVGSLDAPAATIVDGAERSGAPEALGGFGGRKPPNQVDAGVAQPKKEVAASASVLCEKWLAPIRKEWEAALHGRNPDDLTFELPEPSCSFSEEQIDGIGIVTFNRSDMSRFWTELGVTYGGKTYALGEIVTSDEHRNPHCGGYSDGTLADTKIEQGNPPKAIFQLYSFAVFNPWPTFFEDGGVGEGIPGRMEMALREVRCVLEASGPTCTSKSLAKKDGPYDGSDPPPGAPPPLPWK